MRTARSLTVSRGIRWGKWQSPCGQTNTGENITLPQTSFAGGNYPIDHDSDQWCTEKLIFICASRIWPFHLVSSGRAVCILLECNLVIKSQPIAVCCPPHVTVSTLSPLYTYPFDTPARSAIILESLTAPYAEKKSFNSCSVVWKTKVECGKIFIA